MNEGGRKSGDDGARPIAGWAWGALFAAMVFAVWWRGHTFGPAVLQESGLRLWPVVGGESEPLDCDEAAYGYIGRRLDAGAVLYRDVSENKPPGGYWLYAAAVHLGNADELTIRIMPIPIVLATIILVWWVALRVSGPWAGVLSAWLYAVLSTDPYLYGNGAQLELAMNLFSIASLAALVRGWPRGGRAWFAAAGACVGLACLMKQVVGLHGLVYAVILAFRPGEAGRPRSVTSRILDLSALAGGFVAVVALAVGVLVAQGAGPAAYDDVIRLGSALATDTPPPPKAPPFLVRWVTGNSDPRNGSLPWPFGRTDYLVWWGTGSWPLWLAGFAGTAWLAFGRKDGPRRLVAAWTLAAWVEVAMPRQFWAHYYLLPTPGLAIATAALLAESVGRVRASFVARRFAGGAGWSLVVLALLAAVVGTGAIQIRDYLLVKSEELGAKYKGGYQWVVLRQHGRALAQRARAWESPELFVWGIQSPMYFYSGLDCPTRDFFVNDLLRAYAGTDHPLIRPRVEAIMRKLRADPPAFIFTGYPPFPELSAFLLKGYLPSPADRPYFWVNREGFRRFERVTAPRATWENTGSEAPADK